jgi:hypothetical protein
LHFIGTSYAPAGTARPAVKPLAEEYKLGEIVYEQTSRIPYSQTLRCLLDADALFIPGSDNSSYNASKLFPYLLAKRPTLAVFHKDSPITNLIRRVGGATLVSFRNEDTELELANRIAEAWLSENKYERLVATNEGEFDEFTDRGQARRLCQFFDSVLRAQA